MNADDASFARAQAADTSRLARAPGDEAQNEAQGAHIARADGGGLPTHGDGGAIAATGRAGGVPGIFLVLPPALSANRYWQPVKIGPRISIVPTKEAKAYRTEVALLAKRAGAKPVQGRVAITVRMYPARPQDWAKRAAKDPDGWDDTVRSIDLDNALKVLLDALKNVAFDDDSWVRRIDAERCEPDDRGARVEVTVAPIVREAVAPELFA